MKLRVDDLLSSLDGAPAFNMNSENGVRSRRHFVDGVVSGGAHLLSFEEAVEGFLLVLTVDLSQALHVHLSFGVILDGDTCARLLMRRRVAEHIEHKLVINFNEGDSNRNLIIETAANF